MKARIAPPQPHGRFGPPQGGPPGQGPRTPLDALSQDLKLDDKQREAVRGVFELFVVPIARDAHASRYEVIFN